MRIGIFGGTFNPPHVGHLIVAEHAREDVGLNKVVFVPSAIPPHKQDHEIVSPLHRLEMVRLAIAGNPFFELSDIEIRRGGVSFTVDTLQFFKERFPDDELHLLIGMDNLAEFQTWRMPERILDLAVLVVMRRPAASMHNVEKALMGRTQVCSVPEIAVSSSEIRRKVWERESIRYLVPTSVEDYITTNELYK